MLNMEITKDRNAADLILKKICTNAEPVESMALSAFDFVHKQLNTDFELISVPVTRVRRKWFRKWKEMGYTGVTVKSTNGHKRNSAGSYDFVKFLSIIVGDRTLRLMVETSYYNRVSYEIKKGSHDDDPAATFKCYDDLFNFLIDYVASYTKNFQLSEDYWG